MVGSSGQFAGFPALTGGVKRLARWAITALLTAGLATGVIPTSASAQQAEPPAPEPRHRIETSPALPPGPPAKNITDPGQTARISGTIPVLHSRPDATNVLYLDFHGGHITVDDTWGRAASWRAWDLDGNPGSINAEEAARIEWMWRLVAADFEPFDVDVTTENPGMARITEYGERVVVTNHNVGIRKGRVGGYALVGGFANGEDDPAFVFAAPLRQHPTVVGNVISHEAGHVFGLEHDGRGRAEYYGGNRIWGPIMGAPFYRSFAQWSDGSYRGATSHQDDVAEIAYLGGLLPDDQPDGLNTAMTLTDGADHEGQLYQPFDVDSYRFVVPTDRRVAVMARPTVGAPFNNVDLRVRLLTPDGQVVFSKTSRSRGAVGWADVSAGEYVVQVTGAGQGRRYTSGFTAYGSLGSYVVRAYSVPYIR